MMNNDFIIRHIHRVIAHKIYPKTQKNPAYTECSDDILDFDVAENQILITRLTDALSKSAKTFELEFSETGPYSFLSCIQDSYKHTKSAFTAMSCHIAGMLAGSQTKQTIPGGYCIIGDGETQSGKYALFIVKAELQDVFNINENKLEIIKNVFLSPAKDFYKIGYFLLDPRTHRFIPYMYDDQFTSTKNDLTEYFYKTFLGLTTSNNDRILSKGFYNDCMNFFKNNISDDRDRIGMEKALHTYFREGSRGIISAKEFSDMYFSDDLRLKHKFDEQIVYKKYPRPFTKNKSLLEKALNLERISIGKDITIVSKGDRVVDVFDTENMDQLMPMLNNGMKHKVIILSTRQD